MAAIEIPGTTVVAHTTNVSGNKWLYSLWTDRSEFLSSDYIDFGELIVTPEQVAKIAFILEMEYPK